MLTELKMERWVNVGPTVATNHMPTSPVYWAITLVASPWKPHGVFRCCGVTRLCRRLIGPEWTSIQYVSRLSFRGRGAMGNGVEVAFENVWWLCWSTMRWWIMEVMIPRWDVFLKSLDTHESCIPRLHICLATLVQGNLIIHIINVVYLSRKPSQRPVTQFQEGLATRWDVWPFRRRKLRTDRFINPPPSHGHFASQAYTTKSHIHQNTKRVHPA